MNEQTGLTVSDEPKRLSGLVADSWAVPVDTMLAVVKKQLIQVAPQLNRDPTNSEITVFLSIVHQYELNPMLRQVHGWVDKDGRLVTMVGYDGFVDFATNPKRGRKPFIPRYRYSDNEATVEVGYQDKKRGVTSWEWVECWAEFEDGKVTDPIRCYFAEWVTSKWKQPRNRHRMKAYCMMVREVRGFGVMDEADFDKYLETAPDERAAAGTARGIDALKGRMAAKNESAALQAQAVDAEVVESGAPPEDGADRTEPSGTEPEGGAGGAAVAQAAEPPAEPERRRPGRPVGSKNKPKEGGAEPPAAAAAPPAAPLPAPLPTNSERVLGDAGVPVDPGSAPTCYFCGQDASNGDRHPLPDGRGTLAYRCLGCKIIYESTRQPNEKAPASPVGERLAGGPCSAPGCFSQSATVKCVDCGHLFCREHLKLLPSGDCICLECDS